MLFFLFFSLAAAAAAGRRSAASNSHIAARDIYATESDYYVGESTVIVSESKFIITTSFNGSAFQILNTYNTTANPSWMAFDEENSILYVSDENTNATYVLSRDPYSHNITQKQVVNGSAGVVHYRYSADGSKLLGSSYTEGSLDVWDISTEDGTLSRSAKLFSNGTTPSKFHQAVRSDNGAYFIVDDLARDQLVLFSTTKGALAVQNQFNTPAGCGPRHGAFLMGPLSTEYYMVLCEKSSEIVLFEVHPSTLAGGVELNAVVTGKSYGADSIPANTTTAAGGELLLAYRDPDGAGASWIGFSNTTSGKVDLADVYVTNRNTGNATDNIAHFVIKYGAADASTGKVPLSIEYQGFVSSGGKHPRSINMGCDGFCILGGNINGGDGLFAIARDPANGVLGTTPLATLPGSLFGPPDAFSQVAFVKQWGSVTLLPKSA